MDCRKPLVLMIGLLTGVGGCTYTLPGVRLISAAQGTPDDEVVHKASTYVAFGDFRAKSAQAAEHTPAQRQQFREEARLAYIKAIEVDPKYLPGYVALARFHQSYEDHTGAASIYEKALQLSPRDSFLVFELGMCQCRMKQWPVALGNMRRAVELDPGNRNYAIATGYALARAGLWDEAFVVLARVNGAARAHYDVARMLRHLNQLAESRQHAQAALAADPTLEVARKLLADLDVPAVTQTSADATPAPAPLPHLSGKPLPGTEAPLPRIITPGSAGTSNCAAPMASESAKPTPIPAGTPIRLPPLPVCNTHSKSE